MHTPLKKLLVVVPVGLLGFFYLRDHYDEFYRQVSENRLVLLGLSFLLLYAWIFFEVIRRKQNSFLSIGLQASFFVYIFMVLTLTGYFILFREISVHNWYDKMMLRVDRKDHVNLELFKMFRIYKISNKQVLGNFAMLLPLGIYLPLLYRGVSNVLLVMIVSMFISVFIELLQLVTSYRSADIDDVLLNTLGAGVGFVLYYILGKPKNNAEAVGNKQ